MTMEVEELRERSEKRDRMLIEPLRRNQMVLD
jgi:hypothetical protein